MPSIFISHSSRTAFAEKVRDGVEVRLKAMGFTVLLDRNCLEPGDLWRPKLHRWLGSCHGAVILFSPEALQSDWVLKEATVLTWRRSINDRLRIVPALLGPVKTEETGMHRFRPLEMGEIQFARIASRGETDAEVAALVEEIVRPFQGFTYEATDLATRNWLERIQECLDRARPSALEAAAQLLQMPVGSWVDSRDLALTLAHHLLCSDFRSAMPAIRRLASSLPTDFLKRFLALIVPTWVRQDSARHILPVVHLPADERNLAINADFWETGDHYLQRATCCAQEVARINATDVTGEAAEQEMLVRYDQACRRAFGLPLNRPLSVIQYAFEKASGPVFLVLGPGALDPQILAELRQRYKSPTFVLLSGASSPDAASLGLKFLQRIEPELGPTEEIEADVRIGELRKLLEESTF